MARDIPVSVDVKLQGAEGKIPAHGDSGVARILKDATYYFAERYTETYESVVAFLEKYDISKIRRIRLQEFFCLIVTELEDAYLKGLDVYGYPSIVEKAEYLTIGRLGAYILDE